MKQHYNLQQKKNLIRTTTSLAIQTNLHRLKCHTQLQLLQLRGNTSVPNYDIVLVLRCPIYRTLQLLHLAILFGRRKLLQLLIPTKYKSTAILVYQPNVLRTNQAFQAFKRTWQSKYWPLTNLNTILVFPVPMSPTSTQKNHNNTSLT